MIQIQNLSKKYKKATVLNIPELEMKNGETIGIVGNNGAGKTTLLSAILDLIEPTTGSITIEGKQVHQSSDWKAFTHAFLDESFLISYLSPEEYFEFIGKVNHISATEIQEFTARFERFFKDEILGKKKLIRDLSKGNQKKVGIIGALIGNPKVLILDEPFSNLDPSTQIELKNMVAHHELPDPNRLTLVSSHDLGQVTEISTRIIVLEKGEIIRDVPKTENTLRELNDYFSQQNSM